MCYVIGTNVRNHTHTQPFTRIPYMRDEDRHGYANRLREARRASKCCYLISFLIIMVVGVGVWGLYIAV